MSEPTKSEIDALHKTLDDDYRPWATYDRVIGDFGPARPFVTTRAAETRHIASLTVLFANYGVPQPRKPWPGKAPQFASIRDACQAGVTAGIENGFLYERLPARIRQRNIRAVFRRIQRASQPRRLPAFRRCLARRPERENITGELASATKPSRTSPMRHRFRRAGAQRSSE